MDRFAGESMAFDHAVSTYPLCSPHRASLLTGKYPYCCGMWTNCKTGLDEAVMLRPQEVTISDVLHENGYETAYVGKYHLDASEVNFHEKPESGAVNWDCLLYTSFQREIPVSFAVFSDIGTDIVRILQV